ncbi:hypothetical protein SDC9_112873 [bioreactor metagenome]|uniref:Uncharacterized protein n=1 Tax=bioreactor metagenome TaxID=1076179 RepID=A0A645BKF0_9ZZZZ|nr:hypothetical protein [Candidatus Metalachnospira sp.]
MKTFASLAIYMGIGFLLSFIINKEYIYLIVSIIMFAIGIILSIINSKRK